MSTCTIILTNASHIPCHRWIRAGDLCTLLGVKTLRLRPTLAGRAEGIPRRFTDISFISQDWICLPAYCCAYTVTGHFVAVFASNRAPNGYIHHCLFSESMNTAHDSSGNLAASLKKSTTPRRKMKTIELLGVAQHYLTEGDTENAVDIILTLLTANLELFNSPR